MIDYRICSDNDSASISIGDCNYLSGFINIYIDDESTPSPFKDVEDAEMFAKIMVKLLRVISDDIK